MERNTQSAAERRRIRQHDRVLRMTTEERALQLERQRNYARQRRLNMTPDQIALHRERRREYERERRANMTDEEMSYARDRARQRQRDRRQRLRNIALEPAPNRHDVAQIAHLNTNPYLEPDAFRSDAQDAQSHSNDDIDVDRVVTHMREVVQSIVQSLHSRPYDGLGNLAVADEGSEIPLNVDEFENHLDHQHEFEDHDDIMEASSYHVQSVSRVRQPTVRRRSYHNRAREFVDIPSLQKFTLRNIRTCTHCGALLFPHETRELCCKSGKVRLPLPSAPPELMELFTSQSDIGVHFRQNVRAYNHIFSFTSMGVHIDEGLANAQAGVYTYRAQGGIYHRIGSLLPDVGSRPRYMQMYIYDTEHELENRLAENDALNPHVIAILKTMLDRCNPFVSVFRHVSHRTDIQEVRLQIRENPTDRHHYDLPTSSQVAAVIVGGENPLDVNERDIIVESRSGQLLNVPDTAGYYDPLQYPLLHPHGNFGWDLHIYDVNSRRVSCRAYYSYLLQMRNNCDSLLLRGGRLLQQYVVDNYVKISTQKLRYIRDNQPVLRAELYKGLQDSFNAGESQPGNIGRRTILPASYTGSPRDMHERYHDAMSLVQKFGKPDLFITMTCNPHWDEITNHLLPGQSTQDRPDLTTRVFRAKFEELKTDLFKRGVLGKVVAHVHVIEFQKRGLPHAHILLILDHNDKLFTPDDYDNVVRAEIPDRILEPELYTAVIKHMIHGPCGHLNRSAVCMKNDSCKKKFPKPFAPVTLQGEDSFPIYRRRDSGQVTFLNNGLPVDNSWVVPYNPWLLKKYDCHINVEICSSIQSVKYLYKYVYKGSDRVSMELSSDAHTDRDEIKQYVDARWVCPQEALWRIFKFPMYRMYPSVYALQVHLPDMHEVTFGENTDLAQLLADDSTSRSMLTEFFAMNRTNESARELLYQEFPEKFTWCKSSKTWRPRAANNRVIGRLYSVSPLEGERYYLRLLLNHVRGPTSFDDLKTYNSIQYSTFKEAAEHRGLLERDNALRETLQEASNVHMPSALRELFATILVFCDPVNVRELWDEFNSFMTEDYTSSTSPTHTTNHLLRDLNGFLRQHNRSTTDYDLPGITNDIHEQTHMPTLISEERSVPIPAQDLLSVSMLNTDKKYAFTEIISSVHRTENSLFFIDGPGGTGKTFLYRAILAKLRNEGHLALATASLGIAAIMMPGGRTAHSRFKIPIRLRSTSTCNIGKRSDLAQLLRETSLLIWDEATMTHRFAFEALDRTLRDLTSTDLPFGGKVFVLGGDFRQVLPVVQRGTRGETIDACITRSTLWESVKIIHLTQNMRAINDRVFSDFLLRIGDGIEPHVLDDMVKLPDNMIIPWEDVQPLTSLVNHVFHDLQQHAHEREYIVHRAIISPTNHFTDEVNDKVIDLFPGQKVVYYSFDRVEDDTNGLYRQEFLNSISPGGLPLHSLKLKIGCPIILIRNISPNTGLCNGTRLLCLAFYENFIHVEIVSGSFSGAKTFLPRIPLKSSEDAHFPFDLIRKQFPIRLGFGLTINKSQGQTIPHVGIYLPDHVFTHGQLYVALSRGTSMNTTKVLVKKGSLDRFPGTYTRNVVYKDVLRSARRPQPST